MPKKRKSYSLGLRTRAGISIRKQRTRIINEMRSPHKCPRCTSPTVRRLSVGIWGCTKCGYSFAGGAYTPETKLGQSSARTS
jgi:large subunit ribosomal protein L37Ae